MKTIITSLKPLVLSLVLTVLVLPMNDVFAFSQDHDKIWSMMVGHMTSTLELTPEESEVFWPLYKAYRDELRDISLAIKRLEKETDADKKLDTKRELEQQKLALKT